MLLSTTYLTTSLITIFFIKAMYNLIINTSLLLSSNCDVISVYKNPNFVEDFLENFQLEFSFDNLEDKTDKQTRHKQLELY
jgi:hypothetical protein